MRHARLFGPAGHPNSYNRGHTARACWCRCKIPRRRSLEHNRLSQHVVMTDAPSCHTRARTRPGSGRDRRAPAAVAVRASLLCKWARLGCMAASAALLPGEWCARRWRGSQQLLLYLPARGWLSAAVVAATGKGRMHRQTPSKAWPQPVTRGVRQSTHPHRRAAGAHSSAPCSLAAAPRSAAAGPLQGTAVAACLLASSYMWEWQCAHHTVAPGVHACH